MIAKISKGKGFRGVLDYAFDVGKKSAKDAKLINTNMAGETPQELAKEFGALRQFRPTLGVSVVHVAFSAAHEDSEKMTDELFSKIANDYMLEMGFDDNQFVLIRHNDTSHEHCHLIINRIKMADGAVVSDKNDQRRNLKVMREIEEKYGLRTLTNEKPKTKAPSKKELEMMSRTGEPSQRMKLMQRLDAALSTADSFSTYCELLKGLGIELKLTLQSDKTKVSGMSYGLDGFFFKASDLGQDYMMKNLAKIGFDYNKQKHLAIIQELGFYNEQTGAGENANSRQADARHAGGSASPENQTTSIERANGGSVDALSAGYGGTERELSPQNRAGDSTSEADERAIQANAAGSSQNPANASIPSPTGRGRERASQLDDHNNVRNREPDSGYFGGQLADLANASADGLPNSSENNQARIERINKANQPSFEAAKKQMEALGIGKFELGMRDEAGKKPFIKRIIYKSEFDQKYLNFLKAENARGKHIYLKPSGDHGLIFLDDIKPEALAEMQEQGFEPALTVETSPNNYQVWIKLSDTPISPEVRKEATTRLVRKFNGDTASMDAEHFGRLAGFTNRKAKYLNNGKYPFSKIKSATGQLASQAKAFLDEVISRLKTIREIAAQKAEAQQKAEFQKSRVDAILNHRKEFAPHDPKKEYQRQAEIIMKKYGDETDFSRMDFMIAKSMMLDGRFSQTQVFEAMQAFSPEIDERKGARVDDYVQRTIDAAQRQNDLQKAEATAELAMRQATDAPIPKF